MSTTTIQPAARGATKPNANALGAAWVITTGTKRDGSLEVDQICGTEAEAKRELKDLKAMGHDDAKCKRFDSWLLAEDYSDSVRGY